MRTLLGLLIAVCLASTHLFVSASSISGTTLSIHRLSLGRLDPTSTKVEKYNTLINEETRTYTFAVFSVNLQSTYHPFVHATTSASLTTIAHAAVYGLTRLQCGTQLFDSFPSPNRHRHAVYLEQKQAERVERSKRERELLLKRRHAAGMDDSTLPADLHNIQDDARIIKRQSGPSIYLVPLHGKEMNEAMQQRSHLHIEHTDEEPIHPIYQVLTEQLQQSSPHTLHFALLLSYEYGRLGQSHRVTVVSPSRLKKCELNFLTPQQQTLLQNHVQSVYVAFKHEHGQDVQVLNGVHQFKQLVSPSTLMRGANKQTAQTENSSMMTSQILHLLTQHVNNKHSVDAWPRPVLDNQSPENEETEENCNFDPDKHPIFLETDAKVFGTTAAQAKNIFMAAVAPALSMITGAFGSKVGGAVLNNAEEEATPALAEDIQNQLTRRIPVGVARNVIPAIGAAVAAQLPPATVAKITPYAHKSLSHLVTQQITQDTVRSIARHTHKLVDTELPKNIAIQVADSIPLLLTKSITHSVVGSLTHSLAHAPLHDSFCQTCYEHQKGCEHCHFNPNKVFYGLYYSGFYSTYYSSYYRDYFTNIIRRDRWVHMESEEEKTQERLRYRIMYQQGVWPAKSYAVGKAGVLHWPYA